jgi:hypothetical protein
VSAGLDGLVEVELLRRALPRETAQAAQGEAHVAHPELDAVVEVLELAPVPYLHGAEVAVLVLADAHAFRVVAVGAKRRGAGGADPFRATLMASLLLLEPLAQGLEQLVPAHLLELRLLLLGEEALGELLQPLLRDVCLLQRLAQGFEPLEGVREDAVEFVEVALVLHQAGAREVIKILDPLLRKVLIHRFEQGQVFPQGDGDLGGAQLGEEGEEHRLSVRNRGERSSRSSVVRSASRLGRLAIG